MESRWLSGQRIINKGIKNLGVIAIPIIHTRKAIPLNSKQKKANWF